MNPQPTPESPPTTASWYAKPTGSADQALVIEEGTGRSVAVAYDKADAPLLAAAPDLLDFVRSFARAVADADPESDGERADIAQAYAEEARTLIAKTTGAS